MKCIVDYIQEWGERYTTPIIKKVEHYNHQPVDMLGHYNALKKRAHCNEYSVIQRFHF